MNLPVDNRLWITFSPVDEPVDEPVDRPVDDYYPPVDKLGLLVGVCWSGSGSGDRRTNALLRLWITR